MDICQERAIRGDNRQLMTFTMGEGKAAGIKR